MPEEILTHENKVFTHVDYSEKILRSREFYKCKFVSCNFTKSDLRGNSFEDCIFESCNFSMANIEGTGFRNAYFMDSKILGVNFSRCNKFAFSFKFENCKMDYSVFWGCKLKKTIFANCQLIEVEFSEADLTGADFKNSDLIGARFASTILEKADFRTAFNFSIDPETNKMKKAKFSTLGLAGLLYKYQLEIT